MKRTGQRSLPDYQEIGLLFKPTKGLNQVENTFLPVELAYESDCELIKPQPFPESGRIQLSEMIRIDSQRKNKRPLFPAPLLKNFPRFTVHHKGEVRMPVCVLFEPGEGGRVTFSDIEGREEYDLRLRG